MKQLSLSPGLSVSKPPLRGGCRRLHDLLCTLLMPLLLLSLVLSLVLLLRRWRTPLPPVPSLRAPLCRSFPASRSRAWSHRPKCARVQGLAGVQCRYSDPEVVVIIPFVASQVDLLERGIWLWSHPDFSPCSLGPSSFSGKSVDLIFQITRSFEEFPGLQERLQQALQQGARHCFGRVEFRSMNLHPDQDQYDLQQYSPGPSSMFHLLFTSEDLAARYSHFLLMEPDVRAIRPGWVQALQQEVALSSVDFWQKGSVPYYSTFAGNLHINGNAIYKLGDQEFNCFLEREIAVQYPSSFDHSIHKTALLPENRRHLHRFVRGVFIKNSNMDFFWDGYVEKYTHTWLVHGKAACKIIDSLYHTFLSSKWELAQISSPRVL